MWRPRPSVCPVTYWQKIKYLPDFHETLQRRYLKQVIERARVRWISSQWRIYCTVGHKCISALDYQNSWPLWMKFGEPGSVVGIATGYGLDGPGIESRWRRDFSASVQTGPGAHPASCTTGTGSSPGVKSGQGVTLTPHPLLVSWSWKGRAIPLLPLWAVRPVQGLSACTRVQHMGEIRCGIP